MSGSRLPVGSSAMISRGSWTSARAMAVRCCSPPDSCEGTCWACCGQPDEREHPVDGRPDLAPRRAGHLEREGDVLADRLGRQELEVLEDDADLAPHLGHLAAAELGHVLAVEDDRAARRELVADEQLDERRLARAGRPDEEDEVALGDDQVDVAQGDLAVGVLLGHVVQDEDGPFLLGLVPAAAEDAAADGARGAPALGRRSHSAPRARLPAVGTADRHDLTTPSAGTTKGSHIGVEATTRAVGGKRDVRCIAAPDLIGRGAATGGSEEARRDREVAREVGERLGPSTAGPGTCRAGSRRRAPSRPPDRPRPPTHIANAPRGTTTEVRWPSTGTEQRRVADGDRSDAGRPRPRSRSRPASPSGPRYSQPWRDSLRRKRWSTGWATPSSSRSSASTASVSRR